MSKRGIDDSGAAIVCSHVAAKGLPILCAERSDPIEPEDSGWQFLCNHATSENLDSAEVWSINEVLEHEPSLRPFIQLPAGTRLMRQCAETDWEVIK